ncbi:streptothricin acetyltransferase [Xenorhabdus vietnamensis]|uniref:Streptothricin acetyltransferase n=1 Tax=Xenorhabdus vietnamensis TaxID=351656 RepID=A0A1Y2SFS4_9GAMM|nr:GNAT family N-acetyltransferase [Xenorhabdus vietnamensis]OTA16429.1 streptothricin acetyltransferase [Xenorhabdus vietnamensis]
MVIRTASMQDIEDILSLYNILFSEMAVLQPDRLQSAEQDRDFIVSSVNNAKFHLLVAEDENSVIRGFSIAQEQKTPPFNCIVPRTYGYVIDLVVNPNARNLGIGQKLLTGMKRWAQENHYSHLELSALSENVEAIRFYTREGYQEVSRTMAIAL